METKSPSFRGLKNAFSIFSQDLNAIPEDAFHKSFGDKTRTVADIVYEVNLVNDHIGMAIRGEEQFPWPNEGWIKAPEDFRTKAAVIDGFEKSSERILASVENLSDEDLQVKVKTTHGEATRQERCQFMIIHIWYHSGQLNYIQTLLGDDAWHWE